MMHHDDDDDGDDDYDAAGDANGYGNSDEDDPQGTHDSLCVPFKNQHFLRVVGVALRGVRTTNNKIAWQWRIQEFAH